MVTWILTAAIVLLVVLVRQLPMPWRGFVDAGVVVALTWGTLAILVFAAARSAGASPEHLARSAPRPGPLASIPHAIVLARGASWAKSRGSMLPPLSRMPHRPRPSRSAKASGAAPEGSSTSRR